LAQSPVCVDVLGETDPSVLRALSDRGVDPPRPGCSPSTLLVAEGPDGQRSWTLTLPSGSVVSRALDTDEGGAAWVDSLVHTERHAALMARPRSPEASAWAGELPTIEAPPAAAFDRAREVRLFGSFEDWKARRPAAVAEVPLAPRTVDGHLVGEPGLEPMWALDRSVEAGRADGPVFALEVGGEVYFNEAGPPAHRRRVFGRVERVGDRGLYQKKAEPKAAQGLDVRSAGALEGLPSREAQARRHDAAVRDPRPARRRGPVTWRGWRRSGAAPA
jgi:hypothetical protein